jgi:hypothetical protein
MEWRAWRPRKSGYQENITRKHLLISTPELPQKLLIQPPKTPPMPPKTPDSRFFTLINQCVAGRWNKKLKLRIYRGLPDPAVDNSSTVT